MKTQHQEQFRNIWETSVSAWKADTELDKQTIFKKCLSKDCIYRDPIVVAKGWPELVSYMLEFHKMTPGGHFVTREFKSHNNRSIAEWDMCTGDGTIVGNGISYGEYNKTGQLISMTGFFDLPEE